MTRRANLPIPVQKALRKLGQDISDARRRRRIPTALMAERADMARATLTKIEKGDATVSLGGYASVLFVLGMTDRLHDLVDANHDLVGRQLEEEALPKRIYTSRSVNKNKADHE
jgi:transcriptional regulator with XRE-family HTH domain